MPKIPRIYLDTCALIRLFDEGGQARVRAESHAVEGFLAYVFQGTVRWVVSEVLEAEILNNPYSDTRPEALEVLALSTERIILTMRHFSAPECLRISAMEPSMPCIWPALNRPDVMSCSPRMTASSGGFGADWEIPPYQ
jgi:hypothetical protein